MAGEPADAYAGVATRAGPAGAVAEASVADPTGAAPTGAPAGAGVAVAPPRANAQIGRG